MGKFFSSFFLLCFLTGGAAAQTIDYEDIWFRKIGLVQGLPNSTVYYFHQDSQGYIWLTTQAGIVRYDGHRFETYLIPYEGTIPSSNMADYILEDHNGVIWIGYQGNHVIARYDSVRGDFDYLDMQELVDFNGTIMHTRLIGIDSANNLWASLILETDFRNPIIVKINTEDNSITAFTDENGKTSIEHGFVMPRFYASYVNHNAFLPFSDGSLWIGANNGAIYISPEGEAESYGQEDGLLDTGLNHIQSVEGKIWAASDSGIYVFDEELKTFHAPPNLPATLREEPVYYIYIDDENRAWITAESNMYIYTDGNFEELNTHADLASWGTVSMIPQVETDDEIWFINKRYSIDLSGQTEGFTVYDKANHRFYPYRSDYDKIGLENPQNINVLRKDRSGSVWIGTMYGGLFQFPPTYKKFNTHFTSPQFQQLVGDHFYFRVGHSPEGHIFTGTTNGKVFAWNAQTGDETVFHEFEQISSHATGTQNLINQFFFPQPGEVLISTEWSGLQRFRYNSNTLQILDSTVWIPPQMDAGIPMVITYDNDKNMWIGTTDGVVKADLDHNNFEVFRAGEPSPYYNPADHFGKKTYTDSKGNLWFYSERFTGIKRVNPNTNEVLLFNGRNEVPDEWVIETANGLLETKDGSIYALGEALFKLNEDSLRFEPFIEQQIPNAIGLAESSAGNLVIPTYGHGVFWLDTETRQITKHLMLDDGAAYNTITGMVIDSLDNYWFVNLLGLSKYEAGEDLVLNYFAGHGLPGSEFHTGVGITTGNGNTIFPFWASNKGISSFNSTDLPVNKFSVKPTVTKVVASGLSLPIAGNDNVEVAHTQNNISIYFSALQFDDPDRNEYRYKLNNNDWTRWEPEKSIHFTSLPAGTYTLHLQARNPDRIVAAGTTVYTFTVLPPWYKSSLAYLLYAIFSIGIMAFAALRYSNYRTRQTHMRLQAEQAAELAKLDQMKTNLLINISHELRTPLTLVLGPLEQIKTKAAELGEEWQHRLSVAWRNGKRLQQLVEQVLDLARLDSQEMTLKPKLIKLSSLLKRTLEAFDSMAERQGVTLRSVLPGYEVHLQADPDKFEKIIMNLISNAIKFTPEGGKITLELIDSDNSIQIKTTDTGRGIEADQLTRIFDRFTSSSERISGGGYGLGVGLSITKEFVELHGGSISVESTPGSGSTFTVQLPKKDYGLASTEAETEVGNLPLPAATEPLATLPPHHKDAKFQETILIVEDNDEMRDYISSLVTGDGLVAQTATDGEAGKKKLTFINPDLIITDIMMPNMDGFEFVKYVRSVPEYRLTPIIMLSARAEVEDRIHGYEIGISDYLVKPFNEQELRARINNLLMLKNERENLLQQADIPDEEKSVDIELVARLQKYIEENITVHEITVEQLSAEVNMSRRQLYRKLKSATGYTPAEFVREIKLNKARHILERKQKQTIAEVAYAVGFSTPSYFSRLFNVRFGRNPGDYLS